MKQVGVTYPLSYPESDAHQEVKSPILVKHPPNSKIIVLTTGRHRSTVRKYKGLLRQYLVQIQ